MSKCRLFRVLFSALVAVAFIGAGVVAAPNVARADVIEVTDAMAGDDGTIVLDTEDAEYVVNHDISHPLLINKACTLTFNNGATLTVSADTAADAIRLESNISRVLRITIKNAKVVQKNPSYRALYVNKFYTTIEESSFTSAGATCVESNEWCFLYVNSGSFGTTSTDAAPLIKNTYELIANGGTFTPSVNGSTLEKGIAAWATLNGGTFANPDLARYLASGKIFEKTSEGAWKVVDDNGAPEGARYRVVISSDKTGAYFVDEAEAEAFAAKTGGRVREITNTVTFDADGGAPAPENQEVIRGGKATKPATPYKKGYEFVKWVDADSTTSEGFDFDTTINKPFKLKAVYRVNDSTHDVTFHANGGAFADGTSSAAVTYTYGDTLVEPEEPTLAGKYFNGWTTKDGKSYAMGQAVTDTLDLYASWIGPAAACDGVEFGTVAEALEAAKDGSTVTLLRDVNLGSDADESLRAVGVGNLTIDLDGYTLSADDETSYDGALFLKDCDNLVVKDGKFRCGRTSGLVIYNCGEFKLQDLDIETKDEQWGPAVYAIESTGSILSGSYDSNCRLGAVRLYDCPLVTIEDGTFTCTYAGDDSDDDSDADASVRTAGSVVVQNTDEGAPCSLEVKDGTFISPIIRAWTSDAAASVSITGGSFDSYENVDDVADGYALLVRSDADAFFDVVPADDDGVPSAAIWSVTVTDDEDEGCRIVVYFEDKDDAEAFALEFDADSEKAVVEKLRHTVTFKNKNHVVSTRTVRVGKALGTLPEDMKEAGYVFAGWFVGDTKVDAAFIPSDDVTVEARWTKNASGEDDSDKDKADDSKGDSGNNTSSRGDGTGAKSADASSVSKASSATDKSMPKTGDAMSALAVAGLALAGLCMIALAEVVAVRE